MSVRSTKRAMGVRNEEPGGSKRRRTDQEEALWQLRPVSDLKMSSIYNRSASDAPAELFRKDLISAMKLPDSEPLTSCEYWIITDTWKQDWERGVQVPVNPDSLPTPSVQEIENPLPHNFIEFKLPKTKYIHLSRDIYYQSDIHQMSSALTRAEAACTYDLDATDSAWLKILNGERARAGAPPISEDQLERVIEELELRCWDKIQAILKSEERLGIEYDENVICDVCRSPDSEDGNEMVFCDACNICVHQACYGITTIPSGQWLCRPCGEGVKPTCVLCPNHGGAMKCTPSGHKWAHVSCVLWIPEVSIGCAEKMEPITKISAIPASRWSLLCVLCKERKGACIQCSVKTCKTAYHVTCAFRHGLEMRAIIEDENADDGVKLRSYCQKHSVNSKKEKNPGSGSEEDEIKRKRRKDMTSEEKSQARAARLQEIESEFDKHVSIKDISTHLLDVDQDAIYYIYNYWKLKRRSGHNRPLLPPKADESDVLSHRQEQADLDKMKMFVQLRQDLERVRNLCYMVSRREKLSRTFFRMREQTFHKQVAVLSSDGDLAGPSLLAVIEANHGPSIYDKLYSHPNAADHSNDFDVLLNRIAGIDSGDEKQKDLNGLIKSPKNSNPYKRVYVNGSSRRGGSMYSGMSSEESASEIHRSVNTKYRRAIGSTTEDDEDNKPDIVTKKRSPTLKARTAYKKPEKKKRNPPFRTTIESSSEDDIKPNIRKEKAKSKTLRQMEKEMIDKATGSDTDDLVVVGTARKIKFPVDYIYSDSSDASFPTKLGNVSSNEKSPSNTNDSQQPLPRTKAAMKQFIPAQKSEKEEIRSAKRSGKLPISKPLIPESDDDTKNKENIKCLKSKDLPTDLIVPQRQAAKKASENMRSNTTKIKEVADHSGDSKISPLSDDKIKQKSKVKPKESKEKDNLKKRDNYSEKDEKDTLDIIAYVPQRQAAKKAAQHIKSGLGSKQPVLDTSDDKKKESEKIDVKKSPKTEEDTKSKTPSKSSCSSSTNSTSSSCSSSTTSDEEDDEKASRLKSREAKMPQSRPPSLFSPPAPRPTVDLPFLDKVSRPLSSTSASSQSEKDTPCSRDSSRSPTPRRVRPRRKSSISTTDVPTRKAPDKKLKTSERRSECRVPSPAAEREESSRISDARPAPRARTRSTSSSGNLPLKRSSGQRKSSSEYEDYHSNAKTPTTLREVSESRQFSAAQRENDEISISKAYPESRLNSRFHDSNSERVPKEPNSHNNSPVMKYDSGKIISNRRESVKEVTNIDDGAHKSSPRDSFTSTKHDHGQKQMTHNRQSKSPSKVPSSTIPEKLPTHNYTSPLRTIEPFSDPERQWYNTTQNTESPARPVAVEKITSNTKYISDDKNYDSDSFGRSNLKVMAEIQADLNDNPLIKSPKTPMGVSTNFIDPINVDHCHESKLRKRSISISENDRKYCSTENVHDYDPSKAHRLSGPIGSYGHRSIFSPQPVNKDNACNDLFEFGNDILAVDDSVNDEFNKPFSFASDILFKEDSKEDKGVQETLNLVEKLRMQMSSKKNSSLEAAHQNTEDLTITREESSAYNRQSLMHEKHHNIGSPTSSSGYDNNQCKTSLEHEDDIKSINLTISETEHSQRNVPNDIENDSRWAPSPLRETHSSHHERYRNKNYHEMMHYGSEILRENEPLDSKSSDIDICSKQSDNLSKLSDDSQSLSVADHDSIIQDSVSQNYENNNSLIHSDCATISSPQRDSQEKWGESKITHRRSSASSTNSEVSINSTKSQEKSHIRHEHSTSAMTPDMEYQPIQPYPCSIEPISMNQYGNYPPEASPYVSAVNTVSLFQPTPCTSAQLPLPSPGAGLYPPNLSSLGVPYSSTSLMTSLPKPSYNTLCAAFTSSSQNMAITTAMIAPPTPKPSEMSPRDDIDLSMEKSFSTQVSPSASADSFNDTCSIKASKMSNESNDTISTQSTDNVKSPVKLPKVSNKLSSHSKSPGKSPGISPRSNTESVKSNTSKRTSSRSNRSQRGRGRTKLKTVHNPSVDYLGNSIHSKLVGTVYELDLDEDIANDSVDLKAMRERRKSVDNHDRKSESSLKAASQSPQVGSPIRPTSKGVASTPPPSDTKDQRPKTPSTEAPVAGDTPPPKKRSPNEGEPISPIVQPVLPGPVDMRTYQTFDPPTTTDPFNSYLLGAFASGSADQQLDEIDEMNEQQLHSELMASNDKDGSPTPATAKASTDSAIISQRTAEILPKVSLSDSRNQLKVKIKGPFLDANYSTSCSQPVVPQPIISCNEPTMGVGAPSAVGSITPMLMPGTSNLRRMRKKELLRQYWTQDMNMDDPTASTTLGNIPPPIAASPLSRTIITIPKAVASMTSMPTRDDYKDIPEANVQKKKRKPTGLARELRHLNITMNDEVEPSEDTKLSSFVNTNNQMNKRKGRTSAKTIQNTSPKAPKLKIKIGSNYIQPVQADDQSIGCQFRPPKKRIASIPKPSYEDLRRDSMKFRRMVMADFDDNKKDKKHKPKSEKRKRKKDKKSEKLRVVNSDSESSTKLIIKIKRKKGESEDTKSEEGKNESCGVSDAAGASATGTAPAQGPPSAPADPFEYDPSAPDPLAIDPTHSDAATVRKVRTAKMTPIRLKLARSAEGSGYVMKGEAASGQASKCPSTTSSSLLSDSKHSQLR